MRQLILVRHAKSDRSDWSVPDVERPLAPRGERDAPEMGRRLADRQEGMDALYSSVARRAQDTAGHFAAALGMEAADIRLRKGFYTFSPNDLLRELRELDDADDRVAVFGHNPATSGVVAYLANEILGDLPTCAVVRLDVDCGSWRDLGPAVCTLREVDTPKNPA